MCTPHDCVLGDLDMVSIVLSNVNLDPVAFTGMGLVSKTWRVACRAGPGLLVSAASTPRYLTKTVFMGLFGLTSAEADALPRTELVRPQGRVVFMYSKPAIEAALPAIGGIEAWARRLAARAQNQARIEQTYGSDWRELRWISHRAASNRTRV